MGVIADFFHNAIYGTLSPDQKAALIEQETTGIVNAGGDPTTAASQAQADVTGVLTMDNADPSQSTFFGSAGFQNVSKYAEYAVIILGILLALRIFRR